MIEIYTDGSNIKDQKVSWAFLVIKEGKTIHKDFGLAPEKYNKQRNVNGEIHAVINSLNYCKENNIKEVKIYHDYNGLSKWIKGEWRCKKDLTKMYFNFVNTSGIFIDWQWVKGHSDNKYNDEVDFLAKTGLKLDE